MNTAVIESLKDTLIEYIVHMTCVNPFAKNWSAYLIEDKHGVDYFKTWDNLCENVDHNEIKGYIADCVEFQTVLNRFEEGAIDYLFDIEELSMDELDRIYAKDQWPNYYDAAMTELMDNMNEHNKMDENLK